MKQVTISLYSFDELSESAKEKAINKQIEFLDSLTLDNDLDEIESSAVQHSKEDAINHIHLNEYLFFEDGELTHCTQYTGKHSKSGITEFHFHGRTFDITK